MHLSVYALQNFSHMILTQILLIHKSNISEPSPALPASAAVWIKDCDYVPIFQTHLNSGNRVSCTEVQESMAFPRVCEEYAQSAEYDQTTAAYHHDKIPSH